VDCPRLLVRRALAACDGVVHVSPPDEAIVLPPTVDDLPRMARMLLAFHREAQLMVAVGRPDLKGSTAMDFVIWLAVGLIAGIVALFIVYRTIPRDIWGWIGALAVGLAGGLIGGWLMNLLGLEAANWLGSFVIALAAAIGILWLIRRAGVSPA
jgi:uncharacterized membrane protein YeaQ/YmgE (transglycosylase-associated protein family)